MCPEHRPQPPAVEKSRDGNRTHLGPSVGPVGILRPLQLDFEALHANLETVHGLDGSLGAGRIVETHKACGERGIRPAQHHPAACWSLKGLEKGQHAAGRQAGRGLDGR